MAFFDTLRNKAGEFFTAPKKETYSNPGPEHNATTKTYEDSVLSENMGPETRPTIEMPDVTPAHYDEEVLGEVKPVSLEAPLPEDDVTEEMEQHKVA